MRKAALAAATLLAGALVAGFVFLGLPGPRSALARLVIQVALFERGRFHMTGGSIEVDARHLSAADVRVSDRDGNPAFGAKRIEIAYDLAGLIRRSDRALGLRSVVVTEPVLHVVRLADGTLNLQPLLGAANPTAQGAPTSLPYRFTLRVERGTVSLENPTALATPGRRFTIERMNGWLRMDQGALSTGRLTADMIAGRQRAPLTALYFENDESRFAQLRVTALDAPLAPAVDWLVSSTDFAVEDGHANAELRAYAFGYAPGAPPAWRLSGSAEVRDGVLRVLPLIVPAVGVRGLIRFGGSMLTSTDLQGTANGIPLRASGGIELLPAVRFALEVRGGGPLSRARRLFRFSQLLPLGGRMQASIRIAGPLAALDVYGDVSFPGTFQYGGLPFTSASGTMFSSGGHIALPRIAAIYDGARLHGDGDLDLTGAAPSGTFVASGVVAAGRLPVAASLNPLGHARAFLTLAGPLDRLSGSGFADITGGNGTLVRAVVDAGPERVALGPMLVTRAGGELFAQAAVDRRSSDPRAIAADVIADRFPLRLARSAVALPGYEAFATVLPEMNGVFDGTLVLGGDTNQPSIGVDMRASGLDLAGVRFGDVRLVGSGTGGRMNVTSASIDGADMHARASGYVTASPSKHRYAAALRGTASANLTAAGSALPGQRSSGSAAGSFSALLARGRWLISFDATSSNAAISGVPLRAARGVVGGAVAPDLFAGTASAAGADVAALGSLAPSGAGIEVWADGVDVADLRRFGLPLDRGSAIAIGRIARGGSGPIASGSVVLNDGAFRGMPIGGDADIAYASGNADGSGRVAINGNRANVRGAIDGFGGPASPSLDLRASLAEGDLNGLVGRYVPKVARITGSVSAQLRITGALSAPHADGSVTSDHGTLRGVAYDGLRGDVHLTPSDLGVERASVRVGSSVISFGGALSRSAVRLSVGSPRIDLADFNDFFDGWDTLDGVGHGNVSVSITPRDVAGSGAFAFEDAKVVGIPLGTVDATFSQHRRSLAATIHQNGPIGSASLTGRVGLSRRRPTLLDFRRAHYRVSGSVHALDLGVIMPLIGRESYGITGLLDAQGTAHGRLQRPVAHATFALRHGAVRKIAIERFDGVVDSSAGAVRVSDATLQVPFAGATGHATWHFDGAISGVANVAASDLAKIGDTLGFPGALTGSATGDVTVSGSLRDPRVIVVAASSGGAALGVKFDRFASRLTYAPGTLEIGDTELAFANRGGTATLRGTLPLRLAPFGLGPPSKRVDLALQAKAINLADLDPLLHGIAGVTGTLDANASATGSAGRPVLAGAASVRAASVTSKFETVPATGINGAAAFRNDSVQLERFGGALGRGTFEISGAAHVIPAAGLLSAAGLQYWMRVNARGANIDVPNWINGTFDGSLSLTKSGATPYLAGDVSMHDGIVPFPAIYALAEKFSGAAQPTAPQSAPGVPPLRPGHTIVYGGSIYGGGPFMLSNAAGTKATPAPFVMPLVDLNVGLAATKNVSVKGGGFNLQASGAVTVAGSTRAPTLAGEFSSSRGLVSYFDQNFRLESGSVIFDPAQGLLPTIAAKAVSYTGDTDITVVVNGRIDRLTVDLSSYPPLTREQIIAMLLHEPDLQSVLSGSQPNAAQSAIISTAQQYFNAQLARSLLFPFETALGESLDIEQIAFTFDPQGRVNVEVRKRFGPSAYGIYRSTLTAPVVQSYGFAYAVRDQATVEFLQTQSPSGLQSFIFDVQYSFH